MTQTHKIQHSLEIPSQAILKIACTKW